MSGVPVQIGRAGLGTCAAPAVNLYLFPDGQVRPCCYHTRPLGRIGRERLPEIWAGRRRAGLVERMRRDDLSAGCEDCGHQIAIEGRDRSYPRIFDRWVPEAGAPSWPVRIEFNLSNRCNLQCLQCNGDLSSSIRSQRERRPALVSPYDDQFFDDLRAFIPHLAAAQFAGGEPFLAPESYRVWDMVEELNPDLRCLVVTNATQWSPRVERVASTLRMGYVFSLDAVSRELYESIRVGADHAGVMANVERLRAAAAVHGTPTSVNFCMMVQNHHEFGDMLLFAEERDMPVDVSVVRDPPRCSIASLEPDALRRVHDALLRDEDRVLPFLRLNAGVWRTEVDRIGAWADALDDRMYAAVGHWVREVPTSPVKILEFLVDGDRPYDDVEARAELDRLGAPVHWFTIDDRDRVVEAGPGLADLIGLPDDRIVGESPDAVRAAVLAVYGDVEGFDVTRLDDDRMDVLVTYAQQQAHCTMVALRDHRGRAARARVLFSVVERAEQ